jgi:DNA-binding GntR family transcriptional regulator
MSDALRQTMAERIVVRLREQILGGRFPPGAPLLQDSLAADFKVSKIPVREALVQLQAEGLVSIASFRGFQVRPMSPEEAEEVFRLRLQIEPTSVQLGAGQAEAEDHDAALAALTSLNKATKAKHFAEAGILNATFHLALAVPRSNPVAAEILQRLQMLSRRYVSFYLGEGGRSEKAIRDHTALYEAWRAGKGREAARLVKEHIQQTTDNLVRALQRAGH